MFPALPASAIAGALADAGGDMQLAVEGLLAAAQVTLERGASGYLRSGPGYWEGTVRALKGEQGHMVGRGTLPCCSLPYVQYSVVPSRAPAQHSLAL
jgi:hypothetical protein